MTKAQQLTLQALAGLHAKNVIWAFTRDVARAVHRPAGGPDGVRRALDALVRAGLVKCGQAGTGTDQMWRLTPAGQALAGLDREARP
jgi:hypothetical protein